MRRYDRPPPPTPQRAAGCGLLPEAKPSGADGWRRCHHVLRPRHKQAFLFAPLRGPGENLSDPVRAPSPSAPVPGAMAWPARRVVWTSVLTIAAPVHAYVAGQATGLLRACAVQQLLGIRKRVHVGLVLGSVRSAHLGISFSGLIGPVRMDPLSGRPGPLVPSETP